MKTVSATDKHDQHDLVLEVQPRRFRLNLVITALTSIGGLVWLVLANSIGERIAAGFLFVGCGVITVAAISAARRRTVLSLKREGIEHPYIGLIPWHDVTTVSTGVGLAGPQVTIDVRDRAAYGRRVRQPVMRALMWLDRLFGRPLLTLPTRLLSISPDALVAEIEARRR